MGTRAKAVKAAPRAGASRAPTVTKSTATKVGKGSKKNGPPVAAGVMDFRSHAQKETSDAFRSIVQELIAQAKLGSFNHTKLLFEIAGIKEQFYELAKKNMADGLTFSETVMKAANLSPQLVAGIAKAAEMAADAVKALDKPPGVERTQEGWEPVVAHPAPTNG